MSEPPQPINVDVDETIPSPFTPVQWKAALAAGLIAGVIFLLLSRGLPWNWSGFLSPTFMGRELKPPGELDPSRSFGISGLHLAASLIYGLILAPLVHRLSLVPAFIVGALAGLLLYALNFLIFSQAMPEFVSGQREMASSVTHAAFGVVFTGAYKGIAKRRPRPMQENRQRSGA